MKRAASVVVLVCALCGCRQTDVVARALSCDGGTACETSDAGNDCPARPPPPGLGPTDERLARWFGRAVCACDSFSLGARLFVDDFDSRDGAYVGTASQGGTVAANRRLGTSAGLTINGDLILGTVLQGGFGPHVVGGNLAVGSTVAVDGQLQVGGDAAVGGDLRAGALQIAGRLTQPAGRARTVAMDEQVGEAVEGSVDVPPPCACDETADLTDIITGGQVAARNDPDDLATIAGAVSRSLSCGVYAYRSIAGDGDLTLRIAGPTALYVSGDVSLGALDIVLEPGATLDVFIRNGWVTRGSVSVGDAARPWATRVYVGTNGTINLDASTVVYGQIWAPRAEIVAGGNIEVHGSAFVRRVSGGGTVDIHHDRVIEDPG